MLDPLSTERLKMGRGLQVSISRWAVIGRTRFVAKRSYALQHKNIRSRLVLIFHYLLLSSVLVFFGVHVFTSVCS
jgi:hypothetical protein